MLEKRTLATVILLVGKCWIQLLPCFLKLICLSGQTSFLHMFWSVITHLEKNYYVLICDPIFWNICVKMAHKRKKIGNDKRSMTIDFFVEAWIVTLESIRRELLCEKHNTRVLANGLYYTMNWQMIT